MFEAYKRWRHSHGFGVHSPFAYEVVTTAVRPGRYGFYGYEAIDDRLLNPSPDASLYASKRKGVPSSASTLNSHRLRHDARLLLRMVYVLGIKQVYMPIDLPEVFAAAAEAAGAEAIRFNDMRFLFNGHPGALLFIDPFMVGESWLGEWVKAGGSVMVCKTYPLMGRKNMRKILAEFRWRLRNGHGLLLHSPRIIVAHPRGEMEFTSYSMKF